MAGTIVVDRIESDASYTSTINVANRITFSNTVNFGVFAGTAPVAGFYLPTTNNLAFTTASTERMRIDSSGNVGIGTASPSAKLHTQIGSGLSTGVKFLNGGSSGLQFYTDSNLANADTFIESPLTGVAMIFKNGGSERMRIESSGNLLIGTTTTTNNLRVQQKLAIVHAGSSTYAGMAITGYSGTNPGTRPLIDIQRSRGTTDGSMTKVESGDVIGSLIFRGSDGSAFADVAEISVAIDGATGAGDVPGRITFATSADGSSSPTERARIDSSGTFLVGCTGGGAAGNAIVTYGSGGDIQKIFSTQASSPSYSLISMFSGATTPSAPTGTLRVNIVTNGGIQNYQANDINLSDRREKTNFTPAGSYLDKICAIPVQTFNYIDQNFDEDSGLTLGVVAQDVQAVAPELVMESNWAKDGDEPKMRLSIYQTDLQYALMKCIQEQQALITQLQADVAALKGA